MEFKIKTHDISIDEFTLGYIFASTLNMSEQQIDNSEEYNIDNIEPEKLKAIVKCCTNFQQKNELILKELYSQSKKDGYGKFLPEHAGYDYWMTSNGKEPDFWNRSNSELSENLNLASKQEAIQPLLTKDKNKKLTSKH